MLVTRKDINKPQDLAGKKVGVSGIRTAGHQLMAAWFKKFEINEKEVGFMLTGGTSGSFAALSSRQVAAYLAGRITRRLHAETRSRIDCEQGSPTR